MKKYHLATYGCQMNEYDSAMIAQELDMCGCVETSNRHREHQQAQVPEQEEPRREGGRLRLHGKESRAGTFEAPA